MKALPLLAMLSSVLPFASADATVLINFNQSKPIENVIAFNDPTGGTAANLNWISTTATPNRTVAEVFTIASGASPAYLVDSITMKLGSVPPSFVNSGFSISFYELSATTAAPNTWGAPKAVFTGELLSTSGALATYFTFDLGGTVELEAGKSYSYTLQWEETKATQNLLLEYNGLNTEHGKVWYTTNPVGPTWISIPNTAVFYIQGEAIPEGGTVLLGATGLFTLLAVARVRRAKSVA